MYNNKEEHNNKCIISCNMDNFTKNENYYFSTQIQKYTLSDTKQGQN